MMFSIHSEEFYYERTHDVERRKSYKYTQMQIKRNTNCDRKISKTPDPSSPNIYFAYLVP